MSWYIILRSRRLLVWMNFIKIYLILNCSGGCVATTARSITEWAIAQKYLFVSFLKIPVLSFECNFTFYISYCSTTHITAHKAWPGWFCCSCSLSRWRSRLQNMMCYAWSTLMVFIRGKLNVKVKRGSTQREALATQNLDSL